MNTRLNVELNMLLKVGLNVTTNVRIQMTTNVDLNMTTTVNTNITTNAGRNAMKLRPKHSPECAAEIRVRSCGRFVSNIRFLPEFP